MHFKKNGDINYIDISDDPERKKINQELDWTQYETNTRQDNYAVLMRRLSTPYTRAIFDKRNISYIQFKIRKRILEKTNGEFDVGKQPKDTIENELAKMVQDLKTVHTYHNKPLSQIKKEIEIINQKLIDLLVHRIMLTIQDKEIYLNCAFKVPDPYPRPVETTDYDRTVDMRGYWNESLGGYYDTNDWKWEKSGLYDEVPSLYARYPNDTRRH